MAPARQSPDTRRVLVAGLAVTGIFVVAEAVTGILAGSLALLSDAGHAITDSAGLLLALAASTLARRPAGGRRTYGSARYEVLAVPAHVALLLGIAAYIGFEGVLRLVHGDTRSIDTTPVLIVGLAGLLANLIVYRLVHRHGHESLNMRAASIEAASDALGSLAVVLSAAAIALGAWRGLDALVALGIAAFIVPRALRLLRHAADILLESAPPGLDPSALAEAGQAVPGVLALHDLHVWSIAPNFPALSAHVELADLAHVDGVLRDLATLFRDGFGIGHVTLQPETPALHEAMECCLSPDAARHEDSHAHAAPIR